MVVLSAAVITRNGKVLVSRQFMTMTKLRIEGLLSAFPKLMSTGDEHTFIETENVRYLYQPLEQLYVVLITNKLSNIMEDLESLRLVARLVPDFCHGHDEDAVCSNAFQLVFAFDEVISVGYRENLTMQQVRTFTEMDSHEAKLQKIIKASKEDDARIKSRQMAKEIERRKQKIHNLQAPGMTSFTSSIGYGSTDLPEEEVPLPTPIPYKMRGEMSTRAQREQQGAMGLRLGSVTTTGLSARSGDQFLAQLATEENLSIPAPKATPVTPVAAASAIPHEIVQGVLVTIEETVTIACERDGALSQLDAVGTVKLTVGDPDYARIQLQVDGFANAPKGTRFQPHPKIDKTAWLQSQTLCLKDADKGFPIGSGNAAPILKWKLSSSDPNLCPLQITFWPSLENGRSLVSMEFQAESDRLTLNDAQIFIPTPNPEVTQCSGTYSYTPGANELLWVLGNVEPGDSGTIEFRTDAVDPDSFFPLHVSFTSSSTIAGVAVSSISQAASGDHVDFQSRTSLSVQSFTLK